MATSKPTCSKHNCPNTVDYRSLCKKHYRLDVREKRGGDRPKEITCERCGCLVKVGPSGSVPTRCVECRPWKLRLSVQTECKTCGGPLPEGRTSRTQTCSSACRIAWSRYGGARPRSAFCVECGDEMDLTARDSSGELVYRRNALRCRPCSVKKRPHRYGMTATQVARRDGTTCKWCLGPVDLSLVGSRSKWAPSVDHIVPWALGGTNDPENLQLMHRVCNSRKGTIQ